MSEKTMRRGVQTLKPPAKTPTADEIGAVPVSRTINGFDLHKDRNVYFLLTDNGSRVQVADAGSATNGLPYFRCQTESGNDYWEMWPSGNAAACIRIFKGGKQAGKIDLSGTASASAAVAFVTLAQMGAIDAVTATENIEVFSTWAEKTQYQAGDMRQYGGKLYQCVATHTSQEDWTPDAAPSLWKLVGDPGEEWPEWSQPVGAHDAYDAGDKVSHNGARWTSAVDSNVWEPGVYGWKRADE